MRDAIAIAASFIMLALISIACFALAQGAAKVQQPSPQDIITERYEHCLLVWGDSKYFDPCMRGLQITPQSGRM